MKKNFLTMMVLCLAMTMQAQEKETVNAYFTPEEMPDMMVFLPGPPDSTSVAFMNDVARYYWGKEMRKDPERAAEATRDAVYGLETIITEFEEAFGMKISKEETPEIYKVLQEGTATCDSICKIPKATYPSGHTLLGWSAALLMSEINPDRATEILARGYRYGENRLVVGAHWQSDTDAARLAASAAYARLHTSERFLEQMKKAREEYKTLKGDPSEIPSIKAASVNKSEGPAYTLQGTPATATTRGIIIRQGSKTLQR